MYLNKASKPTRQLSEGIFRRYARRRKNLLVILSYEPLNDSRVDISVVFEAVKAIYVLFGIQKLPGKKREVNSSSVQNFNGNEHRFNYVRYCDKGSRRHVFKQSRELASKKFSFLPEFEGQNDNHK